MQSPIRITFRQMETSAALEASIREHFARLEALCDRIVACNVTVGVAARRRATGTPFEVKVDLTLPGHHLAVHSGRVDDSGQRDAYAAVREAFETLRRLLRDHVSQRVPARELEQRSATMQ